MKRSQDFLLRKGKSILSKVSKKKIDAYKIQLIKTEVEAGSGSLPTELIPSAALDFSSSKISSKQIENSVVLEKHTPL